MANGESTMDERTTKNHESYGMIRVSRLHGSNGNLFGSAIKHDKCISVSISSAEHERSLSNDHYHAKRRLIEVNMSMAQYAELLASMNLGDGVPCTIRRVAGKIIEPCPAENHREIHETEFREKLQKIATKLFADVEKISQTLEKKSITKADRQSILAVLNKLQQDVSSNLPFMQSMFNETIEKTMSAAKIEVEEYWSDLTRRAGERAFVEQERLSIPILDDKRGE